MKFTNFKWNEYDGTQPKFQQEGELGFGKCDFCGSNCHYCALRKITVNWNIEYTSRNVESKYICYQCAAKSLIIAQQVDIDGWIKHIFNVEQIHKLALESNHIDLYNYRYVDNGFGPFGFVEDFVDYYHEHHKDKMNELLKEYICKVVFPEWSKLKVGTGERRLKW